MSVTIADAESAYLDGTAKFEQWKAEFEAGWYGPGVMTMLAMMIGSMAPAERELLRQMNPEGYANVAQMVERQARQSRAGGRNA